MKTNKFEEEFKSMIEDLRNLVLKNDYEFTNKVRCEVRALQPEIQENVTCQVLEQLKKSKSKPDCWIKQDRFYYVQLSPAIGNEISGLRVARVKEVDEQRELAKITIYKLSDRLNRLWTEIPFTERVISFKRFIEELPKDAYMFTET